MASAHTRACAGAAGDRDAHSESITNEATNAYPKPLANAKPHTYAYSNAYAYPNAYGVSYPSPYIYIDANAHHDPDVVSQPRTDT